MNKTVKIVFVVALIAVVGLVLAIKQQGKNENSEPVEASSPNNNPSKEVVVTSKNPLPRLVDLGADKCIPCKMMAPILEQLKKDLDGKLQVDFIDVWKKPDEAPKYGVKIIPTQIFFGADGKELFRHEGFISQEDILAKWKELGYSL